MRIKYSLLTCLPAILAGILIAASAVPAASSGLKQWVEMTSGGLSSLPDAACNSTVRIVVPADATQECGILANVGSNPARIGDSNCGASQCAQLAAGATVTVCTTGPIYCYSAGGTTIAITKVQE